MNLKSFENYIDEAKTEDKFMLELGSGISTQLFARNFKSVFSYENNLEYMKQSMCSFLISMLLLKS